MSRVKSFLSASFTDSDNFRVEVNFDRLKDSLKENVDFDEKTRELAKKLELLLNKIDAASGKISAEVNEQRVQQITENLNAVDRMLRTQKANFDRIDEKLKQVKEERKRIFEESLKSLNEGIDEFCQLAFQGNVVGTLEPTNTIEPYLGDVVYYWRTIHDGDNRVTAFKPNYESSLALLFAILKLKKQKFVIVDDATRRIPVDMERFFKQQTFVQIFSLTSRISDDASNYMIRPKAQSFAVKRIQ